MTNVGTHINDPVATAYPGKVSGVRTEIIPDTNPGSVASLEDAIIRPVEQLATNPEETSQISTSTSDTLGGATSSQGIGMPVKGQSSVEIHHGGKPGRKREGQGTSQFGPQGEPKSNLRDTVL